MKIKIAELKTNTMTEGFMAIHSVQLSVARNNKPYLNMTLTDGSDTIIAKRWDADPNKVPCVGDVVYIDASVGEYMGTKQMVVNRMRLAKPEDNIRKEDFIMVSLRPLEEMDGELSGYISLIQDVDYRHLVIECIKATDGLFYTAPSALTHHHAFYRGNLQHTLEVVKNAINMSDASTDLNLLIAGAILHDIGKCFTYTIDGLAIKMTDSGKLLDHIVIGTIHTSRIAEGIQTPFDKLILILHLIASHHKNLEWGSPVVPKFQEAIILHQADYLSASMAKFVSVCDEAPEQSNWSNYQRDFGSELLVKRDGNYIINK